MEVKFRHNDLDFTPVFPVLGVGTHQDVNAGDGFWDGQPEPDVSLANKLVGRRVCPAVVARKLSCGTIRGSKPGRCWPA
ncbi:MAG: hypothetical protein R6X33_11380 [Candidatus Brocadiia bacterium]